MRVLAERERERGLQILYLTSDYEYPIRPDYLMGFLKPTLCLGVKIFLFGPELGGYSDSKKRNVSVQRHVPKDKNE